MDKGIRLDSYLWAIRMYKSRSLASAAIKGNKVKLDDDIIKAKEKFDLVNENKFIFKLICILESYNIEEFTPFIRKWNEVEKFDIWTTSMLLKIKNNYI